MHNFAKHTCNMTVFVYRSAYPCYAAVAVIPSPTPTHQIVSCGASNIDEYFLPHILLWNPLQQFSHVKGISQCHECQEKLHLQCWKTGEQKGLEPRIVHDLHNVVLLVGALYTCIHKHQILSTDPRILKIIKDEHIPFVLLHRTGFTNNFIQTIIQVVCEGLSFHCTEHFVSSTRQESAAVRLIQARDDLQHISSLDSTTFNLMESMPMKLPLPSNDILRKCFLVQFAQNQHLYTTSMAKKTAKKFISFDHTFKVAANLGYLRPDGKWITQYNSAFIVMNEVGHIMAWQFTKTTSIDEVNSLLKGVSRRIQIENHPLILVDNCCLLRNKLKDIFGESVIVKLDIFHAIQRISRKLSKKHPMYSLIITDLKLRAF